MLRYDEDLTRVLQVVDELNSRFFENTGDSDQPVFYAGTATGVVIMLAEEQLFNDDNDTWEDDCNLEACRKKIVEYAQQLLRAFQEPGDET